MANFLVIGDVLKTGDLGSSPTYLHRFTVDRAMELKAIRTMLVRHGAPTWTALYMDLRSARDSVAFNGGDVIARSSNSWTRAELFSESYGFKETYFEWDAAPLLVPNTPYCFALYSSDYVGTDDDHLAWIKNWPDPYNPPAAGYDGDNDILILPYKMAMITREVRR